MQISVQLARYLTLTLTALLVLVVASIGKAAAQDSFSRTAGGLTAYLGVMPAELTKGPPSHIPPPEMHGGVPRGAHEFHIVVAIFDATSNSRISDAKVTAQVSGVGLSGSKKTLETMQINQTTTYGAFFNLPGRDLYTIKLAIDRPGSVEPVIMDFKYDHRR
jgi:hypothetical protein